MPTGSVGERRSFLVSLAALATVALSPARAFADDAQPRLGQLGDPIAIAVAVGLVVVVAFLINRFARDKRKHVRRMVLIVATYLAVTATAAILERVGWAYSARAVRATIDAVGVISFISIGSVLLFDLALPAVKFEPPRIAIDVALGAAYLVTTFVVLHRAGVELLGLLTTSAVVTGVLALSLQPTLGNVIGGVALQIDDSIHAGDWIQLENGRQGKVKEIRWRHTIIETRDWDTIIVPNAALLAGSFLILGKREGQPIQHRMWVHFNVDFKHRPGEVVRLVEEALRAAPIEDVALEPAPNCICYDLGHERGESWARYAVRYWLTDLARDDPTSSRVRTRIHSALARAGIHFAVPSTKTELELHDEQLRERRHKKNEKGRLAALDALSFLGALRDAERASLAQHLRFAPFAAGETMTKQGAVAHWLYILTSGVASVVAEKDGERREIAKIEAPGFFGEMGCMTGKPRAATVIAATECTCYRLDKDAFVRILTERPDAAKEISQLLAERRVGLGAARHNLDEAAMKKRVADEKRQILPLLQSFFGLDAGGN